MTTLLKHGDDLVSKLKIKKTELMRQENEVRDNITLYYNQIRSAIEKCEQQTSASLDSAILSYYQKSADIIKTIAKGNSTDNQQIFEFAKEFLNYKINATPIIDSEKIAVIIRRAYQIAINNKPQPKIEQILKDIVEGSQTGTQTHDMSEIVIEKLQCERDYYQRREAELQHKIKEMEAGLNKKGINIKQMSRTYLEEKCSKWALERLTEEKKILVQRIGQASQQIMRLNRDIGQLQQEIKKITGTNYDAISKSMVGNSSLKGASIVDETRNYERILESQQARRERQIELLQKNQQLMLELTRCIKQIQETTEANTILEQRIESDEQKIAEMKGIIESLKQSNECLNHDYEISLKRKAAFEQQCRQLKTDLTQANETISEDREAYKNLMNELENSKQQILLRVKQIEDTRRFQVEKYQAKLREVFEQKQKLRILFEDSSNKKDEEANYKALLNDEISRLLKQTAALGKSLEDKEQKLFEQSQNNRRIFADLQASQAKLQQIKKDNSKLKKHNKQQQRQINQLQSKIQHYQNLDVKIAFLEQNHHLLLTEFTKYKETNQKKNYISDKTLAHLKEKFALQLATIINQQVKGKNSKKNGQKIEIIEKYIEQMAFLSSKTAQIKQLKDQIRQLKEGKQQKSIKKAKNNSIEQNVASLQGGVINLGAKIMEERIKSQKQLFEEEIKSLQEIISKDQILTASLQEELQRQRAAFNELKKTQKVEAASEEKSKSFKQKDEKIDRLQAELKISRANCRKLQNQNTQLDSELKIKKQLATGLKKQCKEKDDIIKQISAQLSITQQQLQKIKRNQKEANKKQTMFRDIKQKKEQVNEENTVLKKNIEALEDKVKLLNKQLAKKEECLKEVRNIEERQIKVKEEGKLRQAYQTIANQKETIRKLKMEVDRKDQIIKNSREKGENKVKQLQTKALSKEKENQKAKRQLELYERKIETAKNNFKREEHRNYLLTVFIKKLFQFCVYSSGEQPQRTSNNKESIHYYSATTLTPNQMKPNNKSASNFQKSSDICQGLRILDLKPEDLEGLLGETTIGSKVSNINHETSWSMVSPIVCKSNETLKQDQLMSGLQELQKLLNQKQLNNTALLELFKRAMRAY